MHFCPQCGTKTVPKAQFCVDCGSALSGGKKGKGGKNASQSVPSWQSLTPGLIVLCGYLAVGIGLWIFVLQSQPFSVVASTAGPASQGGSQSLPQNHPPVITEEVKQQITALVDEANASPQDAGAWRRLAEVQFRASQLDASYRSAAQASYRHLLELDPKDPEALRGMGNVHYDFEEYERAKPYYQQYLEIKPDDPNVRTDLGTLYLYTGQPDQAIAAYEAVLKTKPDFFQAHFNLGIAYREKGDQAKAKTSLERAKSLTDNTTVHARIDQLLTQFFGDQSVQQATASTESSPTASVPTAARTPFQQAVDTLFHSHEIMGPRVKRIEWPSTAQAKVFLGNFPMSGMPQDVRDRFLAKLRIQIGVAKKTNQINDTVTVELIDADSQAVMETLSTETS